VLSTELKMQHSRAAVSKKAETPILGLGEYMNVVELATGFTEF
jgi:hypothetical protein